MLKEGRYIPMDINPNWTVEQIERARWTLVRKYEEANETIAAIVGQIDRAEAANISDGVPVDGKWRTAAGTALRATRRDKHIIQTDIARLKALKQEKTGVTNEYLLRCAINAILDKQTAAAVFEEFRRQRAAE